MSISMEDVKKLREKTGAGIVDCKKALEEAKGNMEEAIDLLRKKGLAQAQKKSSRTTKEGVIGYYIHHNNKLASLVELRCETDFVAKTDDFKKLAEELSMQVAATGPKFVKIEDVPEEVINKEKEIIREQLKNEKKPENVIEKIIEGRIQKFYEEAVLLEQPFIRDDKKKVKELIAEVTLKTGENIQVARFVRLQLGEE
ncbi:MAG: translation elongation factor Ts [Thermoanaerobaculia bacterium]